MGGVRGGAYSLRLFAAGTYGVTNWQVLGRTGDFTGVWGEGSYG